MELKQKIGARIKEIRIKKGLTQEQLSERSNINAKYMSSIERGKENPTLSTLINIAQSLNVRLDEIFSLVEVEDPVMRKPLVASLLEEADEGQLKLIYKILSVIIR